MNRRDTFKAALGGLLGIMGVKAAPRASPLVLTGKVGDADWVEEWRHGKPITRLRCITYTTMVQWTGTLGDGSVVSGETPWTFREPQ